MLPQEHQRRRRLDVHVQHAASEFLVRQLREHGRLDSGTTPPGSTSTMIPANIVTSSPIIHDNVVRALRHSGGFNAGTALEIASTPVIAVEPDENARSRISSVTAWVACRAGRGSACQSRPAASTNPTITAAARGGRGRVIDRLRISM